MKESLERQDSAALFVLLGEWDSAIPQIREHQLRFDSAYQRAVDNVTEPGEAEILHAMGAERDQYNRQFGSISQRRTGQCVQQPQILPERVKREYFSGLEPLSATAASTVRSSC